MKDIKEKHYCFTDNNNKEWEFLEIRGANQAFYFKCSTGICKAFGMIKRDDKNKKFILTKLHT